MPFVDIPAGLVHYELDGNAGGPVLVLSNSLGATIAMWEPQVAPFCRRGFRLLRYDTRGHGLSSAPPGPCTVDELGRDVIALLDTLQIERAHFCGLSMGGLIGLWLGIHAATRIERLVVCNTAARIGTAEGWDSRIATVRGNGMRAVVAGLMERWFTSEYRAGAPAIVESIRQSVLRAPLEGYLACCAAIRDADLRERVLEIKAPTLIITSTSDVVTPPSEGQFLVERIPGARLVELPAAHLSNVEASAQFSGTVLEFLS